jgi:hypothetical protein
MKLPMKLPGAGTTTRSKARLAERSQPRSILTIQSLGREHGSREIVLDDARVSGSGEAGSAPPLTTTAATTIPAMRRAPIEERRNGFDRMKP